MKTTLNTLELKRYWMTKFRAFVTFLVYTAALAVALLTLTLSYAEAAVPKSAASPNVNGALAQQVVNQIYEDTREKGVVASYEVAAVHDRIEHLCADECACISKRFTEGLRRYGFSTKTVILRPAKGSLGVRMRGAKPEYGIIKNPSYDYHVVTAVRLLGGWRIVDPVVLSTPTLVKMQDWQRRIASPVDMSVR